MRQGRPADGSPDGNTERHKCGRRPFKKCLFLSRISPEIPLAISLILANLVQVRHYYLAELCALCFHGQVCKKKCIGLVVSARCPYNVDGTIKYSVVDVQISFIIKKRWVSTLNHQVFYWGWNCIFSGSSSNTPPVYKHALLLAIQKNIWKIFYSKEVALTKTSYYLRIKHSRAWSWLHSKTIFKIHRDFPTWIYFRSIQIEFALKRPERGVFFWIKRHRRAGAATILQF